MAAHEKLMDELAAGAPSTSSKAAHAPRFARGDVVNVKRYGRGIVDEADGLQVTMAFPDGSR
jgi:hypothetical protein